MNILVCIKQVPDTNLQIRLNQNQTDIERKHLSFVLSPYDEIALEEALRIKEKFQAVSVTAITLGPQSASEILIQALAMGADEAIHILEDELKIREGLITANALNCAARPHNFDLILCGRQAVDDDAFQVGSALGYLLGYSVIAFASKIEIDPARRVLQAERFLEGGIKQVIESPLPCLVTCQKGMNEPRYPSLPGIMKAKKKNIHQIRIEELNGSQPSRLELASLTIPKIHRKSVILDGNPQSQVSQLIRLLREEAKVF